MNFFRVLVPVIAAFGYITLSDYFIHQVWLANDYRATAALWRPNPDIEARMSWMMLAHLLCALAFVAIWIRGFADRSCVRCAAIYGAMMGLFAQVSTLILYVVLPLPGELAFKWFVSGIAQATLLGLLTFSVYRPRRISAR